MSSPSLTWLPILVGDLLPPNIALVSERRSHQTLTPALKRILSLEQHLGNLAAHGELKKPAQVRPGDTVALLTSPQRSPDCVRRAVVLKVFKALNKDGTGMAAAEVRMVDMAGAKLRVDAKAQIRALPEGERKF